MLRHKYHFSRVVVWGLEKLWDGINACHLLQQEFARQSWQCWLKSTGLEVFDDTSNKIEYLILKIQKSVVSIRKSNNLFADLIESCFKKFQRFSFFSEKAFSDGFGFRLAQLLGDLPCWGGAAPYLWCQPNRARQGAKTSQYIHRIFIKNFV